MSEMAMFRQLIAGFRGLRIRAGDQDVAYRECCIAKIVKAGLVCWGASLSSDSGGAMPRMEDKIRRLCSELLAKRNDEELGPMLVELREALHLHIQRLRERFAAYPFFVERRARNDISLLSEEDRDAAAEETSPTDVGT
jgi:hypothetical protein